MNGHILLSPFEPTCVLLKFINSSCISFLFSVWVCGGGESAGSNAYADQRTALVSHFSPFTMWEALEV